MEVGGGLFVVEVDHDRAFVGIDEEVDGTLLGIEMVVGKGAESPHWITRARLDLHHVCAEIGELLGGKRAGHASCQLDNPQSGKRLLHHVDRSQAPLTSRHLDLVQRRFVGARCVGVGRLGFP